VRRILSGLGGSDHLITLTSRTSAYYPHSPELPALQARGRIDHKPVNILHILDPNYTTLYRTFRSLFHTI